MQFGFLVLDGFSNMVLASAIEPLRAARDYMGNDSFSWRVLTVNGRDATSSSGLVLRSEGRLADSGDLDALFVVAGYGARDQAQLALLKALKLAARKTAKIGALDSGSWVLAAAGLLDGYRATVHWQEVAQLAESHLQIDVANDRYVIDRNRITAGGASTVVDLMLRLIGDAGGGAVAFDVSNLFAHDVRQHGNEARATALPTLEPQLIKAVVSMRANLERPLPLQRVAQQAAVSPRTLSRLFERDFATSPGRYYQCIRLDAARALAEETTLSASEIAARTGFTSSACLSRAFSAQFGRTLREARRYRRGQHR